MEILAESKKYIVFYEFESVILKIKKSKKEILIGDFYVNIQLLSKYGDIGIGDWEINNYHTGEQYSIKPYVSGVAYISYL